MKVIKPFAKPVSKTFTTYLPVCAMAVLFVLSLAAGTARAEDIIKRTTSPKPLRVVRVTLETYEEVRYRQSGVTTEQKLSADKVIEIIYEDTPGSYNRGLDFLERLDYENAINSFKLSMEESGVRDWIKTYALLRIGNAYQAWGAAKPEKYADAIKSYEDLLTQNPMTRFYPEVLLNLASCYAQSGDLSTATTTFDRLAKEAYDKKLGVIWEARAKYEKAASKLAGGQLDESERDFRSAETFCTEQAGKSEDVVLTTELNRMAGMARLSQGLVMIKRKRYKEAQDFFKQILSNAAESRVALAGAQNGLAECYLAEGNLKEAQLQFANAKVRYGGIAEEAAKATYFLGRCCLELKDKEPQYKKKANDYFQEVIAYYPSTTWAKEAQKMLK